MKFVPNFSLRLQSKHFSAFANSATAMSLPLFQFRSANNSGWHSLIVLLNLAWFVLKPTSHSTLGPKASGAFNYWGLCWAFCGSLLDPGCEKRHCVFVAGSRQPSNTFGGGSPHSRLVNTCSWHWPIDEAASTSSKSWHFTKPSSGRGLRKSGRSSVWIESNATRSQLEQSWHLSSTKAADRDVGS